MWRTTYNHWGSSSTIVPTPKIAKNYAVLASRYPSPDQSCIYGFDGSTNTLFRVNISRLQASGENFLQILSTARLRQSLSAPT